MVNLVGFLLEKDTWQEVYDSLWKNKLRSVLTMVGVWWGLFLLIGLLGSAKGIENNFNVLFEDFDTNSVFVGSGTTSKPFRGYEEGRRVNIKVGDVKKIKSNVEGVKEVVPRLQGQAAMSRNNLSGSYTGTGDFPSLLDVAKPKLTLGRFINQGDIEKRRKVMVISEDVYKQLFNIDEDPIGQSLISNGLSFVVIGIFEVQNLGGPQMDFHIPFTTLQQIENRGDSVDWIMVTGQDAYNINQIEADTKLLLKNINKVHPNDNRAFRSFNLGERFEQFTGFLKGMQFLTWFVGIATLLAGVFAVGSILLITVKERTKEIGIRRALGATPRMVKRQIILESLVITLLAGFIGVICGGLSLIWINNSMIKSAEPWMRNPAVSIGMVFLSLFIVILLGLLIGLIPANKATSVKPIDALREE